MAVVEGWYVYWLPIQNAAVHIVLVDNDEFTHREA